MGEKSYLIDQFFQLDFDLDFFLRHPDISRRSWPSRSSWS